MRMALNVVVDLAAQVCDLLIEKGDMLIQRFENGFRGNSGLTTIEFLLTDGVEIVQMAHQGLEFLLFRRRWRPRFWLLAATEIGNEQRIGAIGFGAAQLAVGVGFNPGWIN